MKQMCGDTPNILGVARASTVCFVNAQVAEAAARCLADLVGRVMEVSKSSGAGAPSSTSAQGAGTTFYIGDSNAEGKQPAATGADTRASVSNISTEAAKEDSEVKDEPGPQKRHKRFSG